MSLLSNISDVNKFITSKLWYTASIVLQANKKNIELLPELLNDIEATINSSINSDSNITDKYPAYKLLLDLSFRKSEDEIQQIFNSINNVQFMYAIQLLDLHDSHDGSFSCQELSVFFQEILPVAKNEPEEKIQNFYNKIIQILIKNLQNNTMLVCWITNEIIDRTPDTSCFKQDISHFPYFMILKTFLYGKSQNEYEYRNTNEHGEAIDDLLFEKNIILENNTLGVILCILSRMNIPESVEDKFLTWLFPVLLKIFENRDVELTFFTRKDITVLNKWYKFMDTMYLQNKLDDKVETTLRITKKIISARQDNTSLYGREIILRMMKWKSLWLIDILDLCHNLINNGQCAIVSSIMRCPVLKDLWPVLLFRCWTKCLNDKNCSSAWFFNDTNETPFEFLLRNCHFDEYNDTMLQSLNTILTDEIEVIKWIIKYRHEYDLQYNSSSSESKKQPFSVSHTLSSLQNNNILLVLKSTMDLHSESYLEIANLLNRFPESKGIFQAYYSLICALKAILLCQSYSTEYKIISEYYCDMEYSLKMLFPLNYRLETMKNIFSLLFIRFKDFDDAASHSEEEKDTTDKENIIPNNKLNCVNKLWKQTQSGFICNKYAVRETLHYLYQSVTIMLNEFKQSVTDDTDDNENLKKRIFDFISVLEDAQKRLKLFTSIEFLNNIGTPDNNDIKKGGNILNRVNDSKINYFIRTSDSPTLYHDICNSSSEQELKSDIDSGRDSNTESGKRRKRPKNFTPVVDNLAQIDMNKKKYLINFLLASQESLILQCLWKGDYAQAQEFTEKNKCINPQIVCEVQLSETLHSFRNKISKTVNQKESGGVTKKFVESSTLENIRRAASGGVHSMRNTGKLETFLATQEAQLRMLDADVINKDEILTLCALDLAITCSYNYQMSTNYCEVAMQYLKVCNTLSDTEHEYFFSRLHQLLYEIKEDISVANILCDVKIPLHVKEFKDKETFWLDFRKYLHQFRESQIENNLDQSEFDAMKNLITICNNGEKYLSNIKSYLQLLYDIAPQLNEEKQTLTCTKLLQIPLYIYFGHQVFDLQIEPEKVEETAVKLGANLVYSILRTAHPDLLNYTDESSPVKIHTGSCLVLNDFETNSVCNSSIDPNTCISDILSELLKVLNVLSSGHSFIRSLKLLEIAQNELIQTVLRKTSCLASLDLSVLSVGDETLTFFLNVWNVMFLHALLTIWSENANTSDLHHAVSLKTVGYTIGDLGLVTLASLRSQLLNDLAWDIKFCAPVEELNEPVWQDLDLIHDSRAIFAMANEFSETPIITIYNAKNLNEMLNETAQNYIDHYLSTEYQSRINNNSDTIILPDLIKRYQMCECEKDSRKIDTHENICSLNSYLRNMLLEKNIKYQSSHYSYEIKLNYTEEITEALREDQSTNLVLDYKSKTIPANLMQYLENNCWIVSYLIQKMNNENPAILDKSSNNVRRVKCIENLILSSWIEILKIFSAENRIIAITFRNISSETLWKNLELLMENKEWNRCLSILDALPDYEFKRNLLLQPLRNQILSIILTTKRNLSGAEILQYVFRINDLYILVQTILHNINKWPAHVCENILVHALRHKHTEKVPIICKQRMQEILDRVMIFRKMLPYCTDKSNITWYDVIYCTDKSEPLNTVKSLMSADQYELCLEWLGCQTFSLEMQSFVTQDLLLGLLKSDETKDFKQVSKLLQVLPSNQSVRMCKTVIKKLESVNALQFVINYLLNYGKTVDTLKYRKTLIGVDILSYLEENERPSYLHLIKTPLLMLEQLLMNCKFESLQRILITINEKLQQANTSIEIFDKIIRFYAKKALDFRVSADRIENEQKSKDFLESRYDEDNNEFTMPINVPTREEWIPNEKVRKCPCCKVVIFSMFNRRHHCRRCGRVICAVCSQNRIHVSGYPNSVLVRVCDDCQRLTATRQTTTQESPIRNVQVINSWKLTKEQTHNQAIRDEFSFEHAPNISLCLAILNLHSDHKAYVSFLLDRCDEMKRLLRPVNNGIINPEIDHAVIIKMIRSLLVAAKVKCAKLGLNSGLVDCDRFLSQVDLITTLIQSDCFSLIPTSDFDEHALRRLRDQLTEKEQWSLALDVSTKSGLDTQGVWAAWGKAYLKIGYFERAREKFHHCFDKVLNEDLDDWVVLSYPKELSNTNRRRNEKSDQTASENPQKKYENLRNRPPKDPPLLTEILQILDNLNTNGHRAQQQKITAPDVLNLIQNFMHESQRLSSSRNTSKNADNMYYQESLYYLLMYGSYNSVLEFFMKNEELDKCLMYVLDNDIDPELFFNNVYLNCLKNGNIEKLQEAMKVKDSSLLMWKKYLVLVCHNLEKKKFLHSLYQLQLFMKDYVRAAMTCIRFYTSDASSYTDLCCKTHLLLDAQKYLESELQTESFVRKRRKSSIHNHANSPFTFKLEMEPPEIDKHINTISRQMEIAKFLKRCESEGRNPYQFLHSFPSLDIDSTNNAELPTLFGNQRQKTHLAVLAILCGRDIEEGFGIAFRIIQDYNLGAQKVYSLAGHILAVQNDIIAIEQLIKCCRSSGAPNSLIISDHVLIHCVKLLLHRLSKETTLNSKDQVDPLIRLIVDVELKISAYIESKQLKAAYLLAVKHSRAQDIRRILKESDRLGQNAIKGICTKWLEQASKM